MSSGVRGVCKRTKDSGHSSSPYLGVGVGIGIGVEPDPEPDTDSDSDSDPDPDPDSDPDPESVRGTPLQMPVIHVAAPDSRHG